MFVYVNGSFLDSKKAAISVWDRGLSLGDGLFETMRVYQGEPFLIKEHLKRLKKGCRELLINRPGEFPRLDSIGRELLRRNHIQEGSLRITLTRGIYKGGLEFSPDHQPTLIITGVPLKPHPLQSYKKGEAILISHLQKPRSSLRMDTVKSTNYLVPILARQKAFSKGYHEAVLLNEKGKLTECTTSNIFFVKNKILHTPALAAGLLNGITRQKIIQLAKNMGIPCKEGFYPESELKKAQEVFISSSLREILPVNRVDKTKIGNGIVGPYTSRLIIAYEQMVQRFLKRVRA